MNKFFINIFALFISSFIVFLGVFIFKDEILEYYTKPLQDTLQKTVSLQTDLESGKIVLFGSSELVKYPDQRFLPQKFFNNELNIPLRVQGNEGHQTFVIMSQLAALDNETIRNNARIVVLLSPSWFTGSNENGLTMPKFLEYMYSGMMNKLYFESETDDKYKYLISDYIKENVSLIKDPSFIYKYPLNVLEKDYLNNEMKKFIIQNFDYKNIKVETLNYVKPKLDYDKLRAEAKNIEIPSSNNNFGVNNEYYSKFIEPEIAKNNFPFSIVIPPELDKNEEFQDFLVLLDFLDKYKIKPLFIMQDLNPYVFAGNREEANELMAIIKSKVLEHNFEYMDMWTYKKEDFEMNSLTDIVHLDELGWIKVNQKIIDYFMK
ncbi:D-alanyl-lipoteichoic acid biosynthesis protein DltD [Aliarcobacter butzleri]|uniref:D-alanyl-lipoteichoic acid biosynthesis protein DltD n=1 Tax=Aliarcobacter butzleri TaxID=28197 RepID=A0AAW6VLX5_9BACT|nr:D-alanyl-lipoteichoic acid biosynthesis protein DltD [Aliarcobacter butzleri]MCT7549127.1 D-alanyl-lipoteichoic acid biosynthesis protein DltD [Aliarcobacter butzleri]MCT7558437.1 D-alanyl-lipoteichoic acid biosynthesis protein DltD [Aliarcobacter butzleri]MCT7593900.1 D-alanyl-lipoteichoic acid biosynthesis protein DltD [Aliarcobacter butzleri]MCT7598788.1 D-alanyl-lipoteichoic acid biosynthesis protein DltD [Aliarcobacter butzleri]MCT7625108.1 D-alanyl-lipoteichoic acid biosynthesis prote